MLLLVMDLDFATLSESYMTYHFYNLENLILIFK